MQRLDEEATFTRCVLLDGRELDGDWWITRPTGCIGQAGVLFAQDRRTGNVAPLSSVVLLVAAEEKPRADAYLMPAVITAEDAPAAPVSEEPRPISLRTEREEVFTRPAPTEHEEAFTLAALDGAPVPPVAPPDPNEGWRPSRLLKPLSS